MGVAPSKLIPEEIERYKRMAELLIEAGADEALIPQWTEVGRKRAEDAKAIPYTGARHQ
ncbi:MAG: hypothetical protein ACRDOK_17625 [Streptosporangiaceae bacterium]